MSMQWTSAGNAHGKDTLGLPFSLNFPASLLNFSGRGVPSMASQGSRRTPHGAQLPVHLAATKDVPGLQRVTAKGSRPKAVGGCGIPRDTPHALG